jgi:alkylated DNA nucleotide flippase Atl1
VVNARGEISRRAAVGSMLTQRILLQQEGVTLHAGRVPLPRFRWSGPRKMAARTRRYGG